MTGVAYALPRAYATPRCNEKRSKRLIYFR